MGNCLVTKLKGVVDNDNLVKLGEIIIDVQEVPTPTDTTQWLNLIMGNGKEINVEVIGDGYIIKGNSYSSGTNIGKTATIVGDGHQNPGSAYPPFHYLSNGNYKIKISSKYDIDIFTTVAAMYLNLDDFKYSPIALTKLRMSRIPNVKGDISSIKDWTSPRIELTTDPQNNTKFPITGDISVFNGKTNITHISIPKTQLTGDIANLSGLTNLVSLILWDTDIYGDIANLSGLTNLTMLDLGIITPKNHSVSGNIASLGTLVNLTNMYIFKGTQVTGSIESLVAAFRTNGRTEGTINTQVYGNPNVTFNGQPIPDARQTSPLSWTSNTITCNGVTIDA